MLKKIISILLVCAFSLNTLAFANSGEMLAAWSMFDNPQDEQLIRIGILNLMEQWKEYPWAFSTGMPVDIETSVNGKKLVVCLSYPIKMSDTAAGSIFQCLIGQNKRKYFVFIDPLTENPNIHDRRIHVFNYLENLEKFEPQNIEKYVLHEICKDKLLRELHEKSVDGKRSDLIRLGAESIPMRNVIDFVDALEHTLLKMNPIDHQWGPITTELIQFCNGNLKHGKITGVFKVTGHDDLPSGEIDHASNIAIHVKDRVDKTKLELAILHEVFAKLGIPDFINNTPELAYLLRDEYINWKNKAKFYPEKIRDKIGVLSRWKIELENSRFVDMDTLRNRDLAMPDNPRQHTSDNWEDVKVSSDPPESLMDAFNCTNLDDILWLSAHDANHLQNYMTTSTDKTADISALLSYITGRNHTVMDKCVSANGDFYIFTESRNNFGNSDLVLWRLLDNGERILIPKINKGWAFRSTRPNITRNASLAVHKNGSVIVGTVDDGFVRIYSNGYMVNALRVDNGSVNVQITRNGGIAIATGNDVNGDGIIYYVRFNTSDTETVAKHFQITDKEVNIENVITCDDGRIFITGVSDDGMIKVWRIEKDDTIHSIEFNHAEAKIKEIKPFINDKGIFCISFKNVKNNHTYLSRIDKTGEVTSSLKEEVIAEQIHRKNIEIGREIAPSIGEKQVLCHIIADSIIPGELEKQMLQKLEQETRKDKYSEKIFRLEVKDTEDFVEKLTKEMNDLRSNYKEKGIEVIFDVAVPDTGINKKIEKKLKTKVLAFRVNKKSFVYVESILLALRALHSNSLNRLYEVHKLITGTELKPSKDITNIQDFMREVVFDLPYCRYLDYEIRINLNNNIKEMIKHA
ncbi:MAG: WD40 repeat domain-containing protein [Candidatus Omnitrophota bacterium]